MKRRSAKRWLLGSVGTPTLLIGSVVVVGWLLPVEHHAAVSRGLPASAEAVWSAMTDIQAFPEWRSDVEEVHRLEDGDGLPVWVEKGSGGSITFRVVELDAPRRLVTRIADRGLPFGGTWTYELEPAAGGTILHITEDGEIYNPVFRFLSRFVLGYEGTMIRYLDGLERRVTIGG